jgi:Asp-tRNA(Asn)/Glu-tRNA(Gln) amidotransferase A subunit family amidase
VSRDAVTLAPVGLGFVGPRGSDLALIDLAAGLA